MEQQSHTSPTREERLEAALRALHTAVQPYEWLIGEDVERIVTDDTGDYSPKDKTSAQEGYDDLGTAMQEANRLLHQPSLTDLTQQHVRFRHGGRVTYSAHYLAEMKLAAPDQTGVIVHTSQPYVDVQWPNGFVTTMHTRDLALLD